MSIFEVAGQRIDLLPFVREAIERLGAVRQDKAQWLAQQIATHGNLNNGRSIREAGTRLDHQEQMAMGLASVGGHISREVWNALTEKGRISPVTAFDNTCTRALGGARRQLQRERDSRVLSPGGPFAGVLMSPPPAIGLCAAGMAMVGILLPEGPHLPFPACDRDVCSCGWRMLSKREAEEKGLTSFY